LSNGVKRRRKQGQKGVQAVFTPSSDWRERAQIIFGLAAIVVGAASWTYTAKALGGAGLGSLIPWNASASAILLPISIPLLIGGVGLCTYYLAMRRTLRASNRIESALLELEALVGQKNINSAPPSDSGTATGRQVATKPRLGFLSRTLGIALGEAAVMVIIYSGLVQEYVSNVYMQSWVHANFAPGSYLLNYYMVLILAGLLGLLIFRFLPRKPQTKEVQKLARSSRASGRIDY
jgi:MFS family permease